MILPEMFIVAIGLSMDAFAVAICIGLTMNKPSVTRALVVALYFGIFQAVMPLLGYLIAMLFADHIILFDHWIAFILLSFLGIKMMMKSFKKDSRSENGEHIGECYDGKCYGKDGVDGSESVLKLAKMLPLAVATSIDALAVGVSMAFLKVSIIPVAMLIGAVTFVISVAGVKVGNLFGIKSGTKAEFVGGVMLVLIGVKILLEHTYVPGLS